MLYHHMEQVKGDNSFCIRYIWDASEYCPDFVVVELKLLMGGCLMDP